MGILIKGKMRGSSSTCASAESVTSVSREMKGLELNFPKQLVYDGAHLPKNGSKLHHSGFQQRAKLREFLSPLPSAV